MDTYFTSFMLLAQDSPDRLPTLPDNYVALAFFLLIAVVGVVSILATAWVSAKKSFHLTALKEKMVERGMSASEIERVLAAGTKKSAGCSSTTVSELPPEKPHPSPMQWPAHSHN